MDKKEGKIEKIDVKIEKRAFISIYTCQFCKNDFEANKIEYNIIKGYSPICSNLCFFRFIFKILSEYDKETLDNMIKWLNLPKNKAQTKNNACYLLSKYFSKWGLSSVNEVAQGSGSENMSRELLQNGWLSSKNPLIGGFEPPVEPQSKEEAI